jgi:hypothetical protein
VLQPKTGKVVFCNTFFWTSFRNCGLWDGKPQRWRTLLVVDATPVDLAKLKKVIPVLTG